MLLNVAMKPPMVCFIATYLAMKQDPLGGMGDESLEKKQILREEIILIQLQKVFFAFLKLNLSNLQNTCFHYILLNGALIIHNYIQNLTKHIRNENIMDDVLKYYFCQ